MKYNGKEKISVIIIIYNVKEYLKECVDSIRNQSYDNLEIILVDDGSTDGSSQLCDSFAKEDVRIRVIHKENGGLVSARQAGIKIATGEYAAFVDGDDWVDEDMYEKLYLAAELFNAEIVLSGIVRENPNKRKCDCNAIPNGFYDKERLEMEVYPNMMYAMDKYSGLVDPSLCNKLFKMDIIRNSLLQVDEEIFYLGEDAATTFPSLLKAKSIFVTDFCMYHHRIIIQNKTSVYKREKVYERLLIFYNNLKTNFEKTVYSAVMIPQLNGYFLHLLNVITKEAVDLDIFSFYRSLFSGEINIVPEVKKNIYKLPVELFRNYKNIVLYGAGKVGKEYFDQINTIGINIVLWADKNYIQLAENGLPVKGIEEAKGMQYDVIVLAAKRQNIAESMKKDLIAGGFAEDKIVWIQPQ